MRFWYLSHRRPAKAQAHVRLKNFVLFFSKLMACCSFPDKNTGSVFRLFSSLGIFCNEECQLLLIGWYKRKFLVFYKYTFRGMGNSTNFGE